MRVNSSVVRVGLSSVVMLLAASGAAAQSKHEARWITVAGEPLASSNVVRVENEDSVSIRMENGKLVSVEHNGKKVPLDRVKQADGKLTIFDASGKPLHTMSMGAPAGPEKSIFVEGRPLQDGGVATGKGRVMYTAKPDDAGSTVVVSSEPPSVMIGIQMAQPDGALAGHFGLAPDDATLVSGVYEGLPASEAGLSTYDIIVGIEGESTAGPSVIRERLNQKKPGEKITLTVIQKGVRKDVTVKLLKYNQEELSQAKLSGVAPVYAALSNWASNMQPGTNWFTSSGDGMGVDDDGNVFTYRMDGRFEPEVGGDAMKTLIDRAFVDRGQMNEDLRKQLLDKVVEGIEIDRREGMPIPPNASRPLNGGRLAEIEKRMERLERLLEKLVERQENGGR